MLQMGLGCYTCFPEDHLVIQILETACQFNKFHRAPFLDQGSNRYVWEGLATVL